VIFSGNRPGARAAVAGEPACSIRARGPATYRWAFHTRRLAAVFELAKGLPAGAVGPPMAWVAAVSEWPGRAL
jgi:hypothetical protein